MCSPQDVIKLPSGSLTMSTCCANKLSTVVDSRFKLSSPPPLLFIYPPPSCIHKSEDDGCELLSLFGLCHLMQGSHIVDDYIVDDLFGWSVRTWIALQCSSPKADHLTEFWGITNWLCSLPMFCIYMEGIKRVLRHKAKGAASPFNHVPDD